MDIFSSFENFIASEKIRLPTKIGLFLAVILGLLFIDYFFRFSDSYITNTKIKQIEQIESILQKDTLGVEARNELTRIEKAVIKRQGFWDLSSALASLIQSKINSTNANNVTKTETSPIRDISVFWHYATSGSILWLFVVFSPIFVFQKDANFNTVIGVIFFDLICVSLALFLAYILAFIPVLWHPVINYLVNIICSVFPFGILFNILVKLGNKNTTVG